MPRVQVKNQFFIALQDFWISDDTYHDNVSFISGTGREVVKRAYNLV